MDRQYIINIIIKYTFIMHTLVVVVITAILYY